MDLISRYLWRDITVKSFLFKYELSEKFQPKIFKFVTCILLVGEISSIGRKRPFKSAWQSPSIKSGLSILWKVEGWWGILGDCQVSAGGPSYKGALGACPPENFEILGSRKCHFQCSQGMKILKNALSKACLFGTDAMLFRQITCKTGNYQVKMSQAFHDVRTFGQIPIVESIHTSNPVKICVQFLSKLGNRCFTSFFDGIFLKLITVKFFISSTGRMRWK